MGVVKRYRSRRIRNRRSRCDETNRSNRSRNAEQSAPAQQSGCWHSQPPHSPPRDAIAPRNCLNKLDRFKSTKSLEICPADNLRWLKRTVAKSPFPLAGREILRNRQRLRPREVTPNLRIPLIRIATEPYGTIRFDVRGLVDNKNRHRHGQGSPAGVSGGDRLVDRLHRLPEQHYR